MDLTGRTIEEHTRRLGREMFERMRDAAPSPLSPLWWEERLMQALMRDERLKARAFRFIDVLPTMRDATDVARHLREYFAEGDGASEGVARIGGDDGVAVRVPEHGDPTDGRTAALAELEAPAGAALGRLAARWLNFRRCDSPGARLAAWAARRGAVGMARRFIAGADPQEAEQAIRRLRARGMAFTVDVLGEAAVSDAESLRYQGIYADLIRGLSRHARGWPLVAQVDLADGTPIPRVNVSVKLSALCARADAIDPAGTKGVMKERLRPLLRAAREEQAHLHVDMEHYALKDLTLDVCREVFCEEEFRDYPHVGLVLQTYLRDCEADTLSLLDWAKRRGTPVWVRLVKGAYWDTETVLAQQRRWPCPVWERKWESDACYERVTRLLAGNHAYVRTAFASHNVRSLAHAMAIRELLEIPGERFELQMLYGMGEPIKHAAVAMGHRCRIYTPYGELLPGMAYLIRRLLENTANESFLRHSSAGDVAEEELLRDPVEVGRGAPPAVRVKVVRFEFEEPVMYEFENVPDTDFAIESNRQKMFGALEAVRGRYGEEYALVVGGRREVTGQWKESRNPSRPGEVVGRVAQADGRAADAAVAAAADAFRTWRRVDPRARAECLWRAAEIMQRERFSLAALACLECGKPWREADADVSEAIDFCNYYGHEMVRMAENVRRRDVPGETNEYYYAPRGVVAVISPWNFPLAIPTGMTAAALVTGNTVILKPAARAMVVAARLVEVFEEAGLPPGVLNYLPGPGGEVGERLVRDGRVAMIAFTGSREVGCRINRLAAENPTAQPALKKVIAEMGGKNAIIVDSDADLDEAIKATLQSAFGYAGQKCSACSRLIVLEGVYEQLVPRLVEAARGLRVGPADEPATFVPPVIDRAAQDAIRRYIELGHAEARCALEVETRALVERTGGGYYVGPHIFTDVPPDARIAREEIFGPVLAVIRAASFDEAITIFNGTDYALTGGIFSRSPAHIARARRECECGNLYINRRITGALVDVQPFGGFKMSGIGSKAGGPDYLIQFCEPRCVTENTLRRGFAPSEEAVEVLG